MSLINFILHIGIIIVIFGFIWAIIKLIINLFISNNSNQSEFYFLIIKNILLISVIANFVHTANQNYINSINSRIIISSIIVGLYFLGKMQNRSQFAQFSAIGGNMLKGLSTSFTDKQERFIILSALGIFAITLSFPVLVENGIIHWFNNAIESLNKAFLIGFIFKVVAFFQIATLILRGANILGKLVSGKSLKESLKKDKSKSPFGGFANFQNQQTTNDTQSDYNEKASINVDNEGFTEYEDVTDQE